MAARFPLKMPRPMKDPVEPVGKSEARSRSGLLVSALLIASLAVAFVIHKQSGIVLRDLDAAIKQHADEISELESRNRQASDRAASRRDPDGNTLQALDRLRNRKGQWGRV